MGFRVIMVLIGLTGSLGMGKSTTAGFFAEAGVPVHDSDAYVHKLYAGEAASLIEAAFPGTTADGKVNRETLAKQVLHDPEALKRLEAIVHPLVRAGTAKFVADAEKSGAAAAVVDIPLLFETGQADQFDAIVVVTAPEDIQRARAMQRPGMTAEKFESIRAKQMPDAEKRSRADFVVDTSRGMAAARAQVGEILAAVARMPRRRP
jgi:dephospho-CoA kinase